MVAWIDHGQQQKGDERSFNFRSVLVAWIFRSTDEQKLQEVPRLLTGLSSRPAPHQEMLLRMFVGALPPNGPKGYFGKEVRAPRHATLRGLETISRL